MKDISLFFRDTRPFAQLVGLVFLLLVGFVFAVGVQMFFPALEEGAGAVRWMLVKQGVMQVCMFLLPAVAFAALYQGRVGAYLQCDFSPAKWGLAFVAWVIFLMLVPVNDWITWWNSQWDLGSMGEALKRMSDLSQQEVEKMLSLTTVGDLALQLLVVALVPAVCEEVFFRGCLQQVMVRWFGGRQHVAIILTAVIFSLAHGDIFGFVPRLILGLLLGYLFYYSASILVNVMAHFFNNAVVVVLYFLYHRGMLLSAPDEPLMMPWLTTVLCTLAALVLLVVYFVKKSKSEDKK